MYDRNYVRVRCISFLWWTTKKLKHKQNFKACLSQKINNFLRFYESVLKITIYHAKCMLIDSYFQCPNNRKFNVLTFEMEFLLQETGILLDFNLCFALVKISIIPSYWIKLHVKCQTNEYPLFNTDTIWMRCIELFFSFSRRNTARARDVCTTYHWIKSKNVCYVKNHAFLQWK